MAEHAWRTNRTRDAGSSLPSGVSCMRAVAGAHLLLGALVVGGCGLLGGFDFAGYSAAKDAGDVSGDAAPAVGSDSGDAAPDNGSPGDASLPTADGSACSETLVNDGSSKATVPCQLGPCVAGQQVCCVHSNSVDVCVDVSQCGNGVPLGCLSASDCAYGGPDSVCCVDLDDAGSPADSRCTSSACCGSSRGYPLCGDGGGVCPPRSVCSAVIEIAGMSVRRSN
jgi:hypothetical protein